MAGPVDARDESAKPQSSTAPTSTWARIRIKAVKIFKLVLAQWLVIGFALSCVFAYFFPSKLASKSICFVRWRVREGDRMNLKLST